MTRKLKKKKYKIIMKKKKEGTIEVNAPHRNFFVVYILAKLVF